MKILYTFSVDREQEVEKRTETVNEAGNTVVAIEKVKEMAPVAFCLRKPSRAMSDDAELYYHSQVSKGLSAGLLSKALISKRLENDGGVFSKEEQKDYSRKHGELLVKKLELQKLVSAADGKDEERIKTLQTEIHEIVREIQKFELETQSLYSSSAEHWARNKTVVWWLAALLYKSSGEGWEPYFDGKNVDERLEAWNNLDEIDDIPIDNVKFQNKVLTQAMSAVSIWYHTGAGTQEEFQKFFADLDGEQV